MECLKADDRTEPESADQAGWPGKTPFPYQWNCRYAIPLACPAALAFYIRHLMLPHSRTEALWTTLSRKWPQLMHPLMFLCRHKNGYDRFQDPLAGIMTATSQEERRLYDDMRRSLRHAGLESTGALSLLMLNDHGNSCRGQTVAFLFDESSKMPLAVAKFSDNPRQHSALQREYATLQRLARIFKPEGILQVPRPLGFIESPSWNLVLEGFLPGSTAYFQMRNSWNALQQAPWHLGLALRSLVAFQRSAGLRRMRMSQSAMIDLVVRPLQVLATRGCPSEVELRLIENTVVLARSFIGTELIMAARHGDYWAGNLVTLGDSAGVIDWEHFEAEALPFDDLFFFSSTYGLNFPWKLAHWAAPEAAFRATYLQATEIAQLVRDYLLTYCSAMGIASGLLEVFFPVVLAKRAMAESGVGTGNACGIDGREGASRSGIRSGDRELWRRLFRIYAECNEPACFSSRRLGMR